MKQFTHGSLFSGIGGFDLGFERAGFKTIWQVEIDEYCRRVLEKHFPEAERFGDIRECGKHNLRRVDVISGGFPCQPVSEAGQRRGAEDERWMWPEMVRIIRVLRGRFVVLENTTGLLSLGFGRVLFDLAALGFDATWGCISACAMGAPHARERVFLVAYPASLGSGQRRRLEQQEDSYTTRHLHLWPDKPEPVRVADGIPGRMDRLGALGNSVMPQIAQWIAERINASLLAEEGAG